VFDENSMSAKMQEILRLILGRAFSSPLTELSKLSSADLTRSSWAKLIRSYAEVPEVFKEFFDSSIVKGQAFPYTVLAPSYERFIHTTTEKLICATDHEIYVLEKNGNAFEVRCYPLEEITYVEFRSVLLDSSFRIGGVTSCGDCATSILKFNSVTDHCFIPILKHIRCPEADHKGVAQRTESEKFNYLFQLNYKFMNYGKHSLVGESGFYTPF
jgi:hypothetical protein